MLPTKLTPQKLLVAALAALVCGLLMCGVSVSYSFSAPDVSTSLWVVPLEVSNPERPEAMSHATCATIDASGGTVTAPTGESVTIPAGALTNSQSICISRLTYNTVVDQIGAFPTGATFVGGVSLDPEGLTFMSSVTLTIPNDAAVGTDIQLLVGRVFTTSQPDLAGLALLAEAAVSPDGTELSTVSTAPFLGVRETGKIVFQALDSPVGFVLSSIRGSDQQPLSGALVFATLAQDALTAPFRGRSLEPAGSVANYLAKSDADGRATLPIPADANVHIIGLEDVIGKVSDLLRSSAREWLFDEMDLDDPGSWEESPHDLALDCPNVLFVSSAGPCNAWGWIRTTFEIGEVSFYQDYGPFLVNWATRFDSSDSSIAAFDNRPVSNNILFAQRPGDITATATWMHHNFQALNASQNVSCQCAPDQVQCSGQCYPGTCCTDADCPTQRTCVNHTCQGWESRALNRSPSAWLSGRLKSSAGHSLSVLFPPDITGISLASALPTEGPLGSHVVTTTLTSNFEQLTNATEVYTADFVDDQTSVVRAEVLALKTQAEPYSHDYSVCERFHGFTLHSVSNTAYQNLPGTSTSPWFWHCVMFKDTVIEHGAVLTALVDEETHSFLIDSRWLEDDYPRPLPDPYDYIFNFQVWSRTSSADSEALVRGIITQLQTMGTVSYANGNQPSPAHIFVRSASYSGDTLYMTVQSDLLETQNVSLVGTMRPYTDTTTSLPVNFQVVIQPGVNPIELPLSGMIDGVFHIIYGGFHDKFYVGGGFWFQFNDSTSSVEAVPISCTGPAGLSALDLQLDGCYHITGDVGSSDGYVGMGRVFNPNGQPVDISGYKALTFRARGDGNAYRASIETENIDDYDFYGYVFAPPANTWRQYVIPLSRLRQHGWGAVVPFTGQDVKSVGWQNEGRSPSGDTDLAVERVSFTNAVVIEDVSRLPSTQDQVGPYTVTARILDSSQVVSGTLVYSTDGGDTFFHLPMSATGNLFTGAIPGQPWGTEVRYYIEAANAAGANARWPIDAPEQTYRIRVSDQPLLLIDDYNDYLSTNALDGNSWNFGAESGGTIGMTYDGEKLRLDYNVAAESSYAGYVTSLEHADVRPHNQISFRIRGAAGGERVKIGLHDSLGNEPKRLISQFLPGGITTAWQQVVMPLDVFTELANLSDMTSLVIAFENGIGSGQGTVYVDDIVFERAMPGSPATIDNFNDMSGRNALDAGLATASGGGAGISIAYDTGQALGGVGAAWRLTFAGVTPSGWALAESPLKGFNATAYRTLALAIKGAAGGERPNIYLADTAGQRAYVDIENYLNLSTAWQQARIPVEDFAAQGINLAHLDKLQIVFEWDTMSGTVYVDDLKFSDASLGIQAAGESLRLEWPAGMFYANAGRLIPSYYAIWRGTTPYFDPYAAGCPCTNLGTTTALNFTDTGIGGADVIGDPTYNYFYLVEAVETNESSLTNVVGKFDFSLRAGQN